MNRLRELLAKGTPGPWETAPPSAIRAWPRGRKREIPDTVTAERVLLKAVDAALIVAAVNALPKLLNDIEKARSLVALHEEYEQFLNEANEGPLSLASIHGWRCPEAEFQRGLDYRQQIAALRAALASLETET